MSFTIEPTMKASSSVCAKHFKLLVVGGGAGGLGAASKFARKLPKGSVGIVEPHEDHYYQPGFTLVGGGLMTLEANKRKEAKLIPRDATWIQNKVVFFTPTQNALTLKGGEDLSYHYMVISMGAYLRFDKIKGALEALETAGVCSNYSPFHVEKHFQEVLTFKDKKAKLDPRDATWIQNEVVLFTSTQNALTLKGGEDLSYDYMVVEIGAHLRFDKAGPNICMLLGEKENLGFMNIKSTLEALETAGVCSNYSPFLVEKRFQDALTFKGGNAIYTYPNAPIKCAGAPQKACYITDSILRKRGVRDEAKLIYATSLNRYALLHIGPPCSAPKALRSSPFADKTGFMDVDGETLQSKRFPNVFGVGDCMNTPNAKTAASVSSHLKIIDKNLSQVMLGRKPKSKYDGYASCPLVVSRNSAILAEFNPEGPLETTPFNQKKPSRWAYFLKRHILPALYWNGLIKGYWNGPGTMRKFTRMFKSD